MTEETNEILVDGFNEIIALLESVKVPNEVKINIDGIIDAIKNKKIPIYEDAEILKKLDALEKALLSIELKPKINVDVPKQDIEATINEDDIKKIVKAIENIKIIGGSGGSASYIKNVSGTTVNPATEDKQDTLISAVDKLVGFPIGEYDEIALTYVASGNGVGEIETVTYKLAGTTIATLTLAYDSNNNLSSIIKT